MDLSSGFKPGTVKFVGETEFQPGEWIGVALDRPLGERGGTSVFNSLCIQTNV